MLRCWVHHTAARDLRERTDIWRVSYRRGDMRIRTSAATHRSMRA